MTTDNIYMVKILRHLMVWIVVSLLANPVLAQAPAGDFLPGLEDVPAHPGLKLEREDGVVFDSPAGRIVEIFATSTLTRKQIGDFYNATLPELGWQAMGNNLFHREEEQLTLDFFGTDGNISVRFTLAPL